MSVDSTPPSQRGARSPAGNTAAAPTWHELSRSAELVADAAESFASIGVGASREALYEARDALLVLTTAGDRLAKLLDALASYYDAPGMPQPTSAYVALEQAAAAAEDLGVSTRRAAQALRGQD